MNHDVVVIGGSAGTVSLLLTLVPSLPADFPASIFIVLHTSPEHASPLPQLLSDRGPLPAHHPLHGDPILPGHIYIAPPDNHLYVRPGVIDVVRGPKENGHRPSVDALFRTAAASYGSRVVGVVLSGHQDCGTAGMMSVKARGGISVVQDPASASASEMPRNVLENVQVDHVVAPGDLPQLLSQLVATPAGGAPPVDETIAKLEGAAPSAPADLVCPLCQGVLSETQQGTFQHYRCHVGHTFSLESLLVEQGESMERALWSAARALEESASLNRRLSRSGSREAQARFAEAAGTQASQAEMIREFLLHRRSPGKAPTPAETQRAKPL